MTTENPENLPAVVEATPEAPPRKRPPNPLANLMEKKKESILNLLPVGVSFEKFAETAQMAALKTPDIMKLASDPATMPSLFIALGSAARDGLIPDGREAALVIDRKEGVRYMPMVQGVIKRVQATGAVLRVTAFAVYTNDKFKYWVDDNGEHFRYIQHLDDDRGEFRGVCAWAQLKGGNIAAIYMNKAQILKARAVSRANYPDAPWNKWFDAMAEKTAIHKLCRRLPLPPGTLLFESDSFDDSLVTSEQPSEVTLTASAQIEALDALEEN